MKLIINKELNQDFDFESSNVYAIFTNICRLDKNIIDNNCNILGNILNFDWSIFDLSRFSRKQRLGKFLKYYGLGDNSDRIIEVLNDNVNYRFKEDNLFDKEEEMYLDFNSKVSDLFTFTKAILLAYIKLKKDNPVFFLTNGLTYQTSLMLYRVLYKKAQINNKIVIVIENKNTAVLNEIIKVDNDFLENYINENRNYIQRRCLDV